MNSLKKRVLDSHRFRRRAIVCREVLLIAALVGSICMTISTWRGPDVFENLLVSIILLLIPLILYGNLIRHSELFVPRAMRTSIEAGETGTVVRVPKMRSKCYFGSIIAMIVCGSVLALATDYLGDAHHRGSPKFWATIAVLGAIAVSPVIVQHRVIVFRMNSVEMFNYLPRRDMRVLVDPVEEIVVGPMRSVLGKSSAQWIVPSNRRPLKQERVFIHIELALANSSYFPHALEDIARVTGRPVLVRKQ